MRRGLFMVASLALAGWLFCPPPGAAQQQTPQIIRGAQSSPAAPAGADAAYQKGLEHLESKDYAKAVETFQQAVAGNPRSADAYYRLGLALQGQGSQDKAIQSLKKALALNPQFSQARESLGNIYGQQGLDSLRQGDPDRAAGLLRQAVSLNPKSDKSLNNLGVALGQQGRYTESVSAFQQAATANPNNTQAQFNLGATQYALGDKNAAVRQYAILTLKDPAAADTLFRIIQGTSQVATPFRF
jgi:tetratricopeptide (TPR) repeat protein